MLHSIDGIAIRAHSAAILAEPTEIVGEIMQSKLAIRATGWP